MDNNIDESTIEEMISLFAKNGRPDLIYAIRVLYYKDGEYTPSDNETDDNDSDIGDGEDINIKMDDDGFVRLSDESD
tara:strand:+ start:168 stop:398 length:231 start_codon:yes stop_codon:yes gene_type:complete